LARWSSQHHGSISRSRWRIRRGSFEGIALRHPSCRSLASYGKRELGAKAADVVGLYIAPPEKAILLCIDEKLQALERAQGYLKLPNGRALTGQSHDYKRHGTTTLFAASKSPPERSSRHIQNGAAGSSFWAS
jgi:hypothetical protein